MADVLYKFFPPERLTALQNRLVRFTPPEEFNDPFDIAPVAVTPTPAGGRVRARRAPP